VRFSQQPTSDSVLLLHSFHGRRAGKTTTTLAERYNTFGPFTLEIDESAHWSVGYVVRCPGRGCTQKGFCVASRQQLRHSALNDMHKDGNLEWERYWEWVWEWECEREWERVENGAKNKPQNSPTTAPSETTIRKSVLADKKKGKNPVGLA